MLRRAIRFFKTPKGILCLILAVLGGIAAPVEGLRAVLPGLIAATLAAGLVDAVILRLRNRKRPWQKRKWELPDGAILTALIVAMVLRAQEPWYVVAATAVAGVISKYVFRSRTANVFNPAAFAIVLTFYVFHTGQNWWGALADLPPVVQLALPLAGIFITDRVNKLPLVLSFLGTYFLLFTVAAFVGNPRWVAEIFRAPDLEAVLFFSFIILTDPPTSPAKYPDQLIYGMLVAAASFAFFEFAGVVYYLLAGVLVGNVWEAWRRVSKKNGSSFPAGIGAFLAEVRPLRAWV